MQLNDKIALKKLREVIEAQLSAVVETLGLESLKTGNISYDASGTEAKIQVIAKAKREDGRIKEEIDYEKYAEMFGLKLDWLHMSYRRQNGETVEILGLCPNRSKFPVLVVNTKTNKRFLLTIEEVQKKLGGVKVVPMESTLELVPPPPRTS
jgi:hypothetical protein